jgi:hypothetical protein
MKTEAEAGERAMASRPCGDDAETPGLVRDLT